MTLRGGETAATTIKFLIISMAEQTYEQWLEKEFGELERSDLFRLAGLKKYSHDPAFTQKLMHAAANAERTISRVPRTYGKKKVEDQEFCNGAYAFFRDQQVNLASEYVDRLSSEIDEEKVQTFLMCMKDIWTDGKQRQTHPLAQSIKASIQQYDQTFRSRTVFVREKVSAGIRPLFTPDEMHKLLDVNSTMAFRTMEDYLQQRPDWEHSSINHVFVHRGFYPRRPLVDRLLVEQHYLSSYSLAASVAEAFSQVTPPTSEGLVFPTIESTPFPVIEKRILAFSPMIPGMSVEQIELVLAPPVEALPLEEEAIFEFDGTKFLERQYDQCPPGSRWTGPFPSDLACFN